MCHLNSYFSMIMTQNVCRKTFAEFNQKSSCLLVEMLNFAAKASKIKPVEYLFEVLRPRIETHLFINKEELFYNLKQE